MKIESNFRELYAVPNHESHYFKASGNLSKTDWFCPGIA